MGHLLASRGPRAAGHIHMKGRGGGAFTYVLIPFFGGAEGPSGAGAAPASIVLASPTAPRVRRTPAPPPRAWRRRSAEASGRRARTGGEHCSSLRQMLKLLGCRAPLRRRAPSRSGP